MHRVVHYLLNPVGKSVKPGVVLNSLVVQLISRVSNYSTCTNSLHMNRYPLTTARISSLYPYFHGLSTSSTWLTINTTNLITI